MPRKFGKFFLKLLGVIAFLAVSAYALFLAYGYRYNFQQSDVQKTSIIDLASIYSDVTVFLNDQKVVHSNLPYLLKDLLPGAYNLKLEKIGYLPWQRALKVSEDLVTRVEDVIFVPAQLDTYRKLLVNFGSDVKTFASTDSLAYIRPKQSFFTFITFKTDGLTQLEEIQLNRSDIQEVKVFPGQRFFIRFEGKAYEWIDFRRNQFFTFDLPDFISDYRIDDQNGLLYFIRENGLYKVPFSVLDTFSQEEQAITLVALAQYKMAENLDDYAFADDGFYALQKGKLSFYQDKNSTAVTLGYFAPKDITNVRAYTEHNHDFIILKGTSQRSLYYLNDSTHFTFLTHQLDGEVLFNDLDQIVYKNRLGEFFVYDPRIDEQILLPTNGKAYSLLGWFDDQHLLLKEKDQVLMSDLLFSNVYDLGKYENTQFFMVKRALFYLVDGVIRVLFWK